jgi:hypothetical protein
VGAAYDPVRDELYLSKDGDNSRVWVYSRDGTSFTQVRFFTVSTIGVGDAEGLAFGNNTLYIADGLGKEVWAMEAGTDGVVGSGSDDVVSQFDVASLGMNDPEGIGFHPVTGNLWLASRHPVDGILEVTTSGAAVSHASYQGFTPISPAGVEVAPSSADPSAMSVWVTDRGIDNNDNSSENDGKIYELTMDEVIPPPPPSGDDVISNGGFEVANGSNQPTGWSTDPRFTQSDVLVHSDSFAGRHFATDNSGYKITQDAPITGGTSYAFSVWVNAPATSDGFKVVFKIQWRSNSGKVGDVTLTKVTKSTNGWVNLTAPATSPASATVARVMMVVSSLNATVYVDDLVLAGN